MACMGVYYWSVHIVTQLMWLVALQARMLDPPIPRELASYVAAIYVDLRREEQAADLKHSYTTARTLLSLFRMAQALARLRLADTVQQVGQKLLGHRLCLQFRLLSLCHRRMLAGTLWLPCFEELTSRFST